MIFIKSYIPNIDMLINPYQYIKFKSYLIFSWVQEMTDPDDSKAHDEMIPAQFEQPLITLTNTLIAPPAAPHVSGLVIQASVCIPKSTHWLLVLSKFHAQFTWKKEGEKIKFMDKMLYHTTP